MRCDAAGLATNVGGAQFVIAEREFGVLLQETPRMEVQRLLDRGEPTPATKLIRDKVRG